MASVRNTPNGQWVMLHWFENGKPVRPVKLGLVGKISQRAIDLAIKQKDEELALGGHGAAGGIGRATRFADLAQRYMLDRKHPASRKRVERTIVEQLVPRFGKLTLDKITVELVDTYVVERLQTFSKVRDTSKTLSPSTVEQELEVLKAMFSKALEWELIRHNRVKYVKAPSNTEDKPVDGFTKEDIQKIIAVGSPYAPVWNFMAHTGLRRGELMHLKLEDIHATYITVLSTNARRTKSGKSRVVTLSPGARQAAEVLVARARQAGSLYLIPSVSATRSGQSIYYNLTRDCRAAGIVGWPHKLRHTFASHLMMKGKNIHIVQKLMGHASVTQTEAYSHFAPGFERSATDDFEI